MYLPTSGLIGIAIVLGAVLCLFGYRVFKAVLALLGFLLGYALVFTLVDPLFQYQFVALFAGLAAGIVCGSLINGVYLIGVFIASSLFGAALAMHLYAVAGQHAEPAGLFIFAALSGLFALFFQKFMIILATALTGAWGVVAGLAWFLSGAMNPIHITSVERYFRSGDTHAYGVVLWWLALSAAGMLFQYKRLPGMKSRDVTTTRN